MHLAVAVLALAVVVSPLTRVEAAGPAGPYSRLQADGLTHVVKMKKAKKAKTMRKAKRKPGRQARSRGPGHCGENMYWGRKAGKCLDARNKA
jgi:hypothetical protein